MKESIGPELYDVRFTNALQNHPACLSSEGALSVNMEKVLNKMPGAMEDAMKAQLVLEINVNHPIAQKLKALYPDQKEELAKYSKLLYAGARMTGGLPLENPAEINNLICDLMLA